MIFSFIGSWNDEYDQPLPFFYQARWIAIEKSNDTSVKNLIIDEVGLLELDHKKGL